MLADAEIVVRAPDGDLGADPVIKGARKLAAAPLEVGKDAVSTLGTKCVETVFEEAVELHPKQQLSRRIDAVSRASGGIVETK